ncbi:MAG: hypothetical protein HY261_06710, partial [Chloroflexi bacterium]|nr:hypothetical protein [Chloroflexota bacterium]
TVVSNASARAFTDEELVPNLDMVISISNRGYAKRLVMDAYRIQRRGGMGVRGMITREQDVVEHLAIADTHDHVLFFTNKGRVLHTKCFRIPQEATRAAKGTPLINIIPVLPDERVTAVVATKEFDGDSYLFMATKNGRVKRTQLQEFAYAVERTKGIIAMRLPPGDELVSARIVKPGEFVVGVSHQGRAVHFCIDEVRAQHRSAAGVRGMRLDKGDRLLGMDGVTPDAYLLVIGTHGLGKLTKLENYTTHHRGTHGVLTLRITPKTGPIAAARVVHPDEELIVISRNGIMLRTRLDEVRVTGRTAQGVRVMNIDAGDSVASIASFNAEQGAAPNGNGTPKALPSAAAASDDDKDAKEATIEEIDDAEEGAKPKRGKAKAAVEEKPKAKADAKAEAVEAKAEAKAEVKAPQVKESKPKPAAKVKAVTKPVAKAKAVAKPTAKAKAVAKPAPKVAVKPKTAAKAKKATPARKAPTAKKAVVKKAAPKKAAKPAKAKAAKKPKGRGKKK